MLRPLTVLLIDNDPVQRLMIRAHLELLACREGFALQIDEREGVESPPAGPYDAVVIDLELRLSATARTLAAIRSLPGPAVCIATDPAPEDESRARKAGCDHYLVKGFFSAADLGHAILDAARSWSAPSNPA